MLHQQRQVLIRELADVVPFVVIGSAALGVYVPAVIPRQPSDVDLLVPGDLTQLNQLCSALSRRGFSLWTWGERVQLPLKQVELKGRFYLRAICGEVCLDLTYECPWVPFASAWQQRVLWRGIPLASLTHITRLMAVRQSEKDCARLQQLGLHWPVSTSLSRGSVICRSVGQAVAPQIAA